MPSDSGRTGKKQRMNGYFYAASASAVKWPAPAAWNRHRSYSGHSRDTGRNIPEHLAHLLFANNYYLSALGSLTAPLANMIASTKIGKKDILGHGNINLYSLP